MSAVLEVRGLRAGYNGSAVIEEIDIEVPRRSITALLGPNGSGKSTTMNAIAGLITPMAGEVVFNGQYLGGPLHRRARRGISYVAQDRYVFRELTVAENIRMARCDTKLVLALFPELVGMLSRPVGLLSGGEQQMLAIGRALAREPELLMVDELSLGLAPIAVGRLLQALREAADNGMAILVVEQHVRRILKFVDRALVLNSGRVVLADAAANLRGRMDDLEAAYFGTAARNKDGTVV